MKLRDRLGALVLAAAAIALGAEPAHPQTPAEKAGQAVDTSGKITGLRGEWRRAGAGFACVVKAPEKLEANPAMPAILARACTFLGLFALGDDAGAVVKALGTPHRTLAQPGGAKASVYFLEQVGHHP